MSLLIVLKEGDCIVLGSDSRFVSADRACIVTDAAEKIIEIAPDVFLSTSGYSLACEFQNAKARELARSTQDIRILSVILAQASTPILERAAAALANYSHVHADIASAVAGGTVLHAAVLAGRNSSGELGYVFMESRCTGGRVTTTLEENFRAPRQLHISSAVDFSEYVARNRERLRTGPPEDVVNAMIDALKSAEIGGPTQMVQLDSTGSRWISRLPEAIRQEEYSVGVANFAGPVTFQSGGSGPYVEITSSGISLSAGSSEGALLDGAGNLNLYDGAGSGTVINPKGISLGQTGAYPIVLGSSNGVGITGAYLSMAPSPLGSLSVPNGSLAISDGSGGYTVGKLYRLYGGTWTLIG